MSDLKRTVEERIDVEASKPINHHVECTLLLADLPDPDAGKTDEERAEIVRARFTTHRSSTKLTSMFTRTANSYSKWTCG